MRSSPWFSRRSRRPQLSLPGLAAAISVLFAVSVAGATFFGVQETADERADPRLAMTREWAMKHFPQLARPTFAKLEIAGMTSGPSEGPEKFKFSFKDGEIVNFRLLITNTSQGPVSIPVGGRYDHNRPQLLRDGAPVPYSKEAERLVERVDGGPGYRSVRYERIESDQTVTDVIHLSDWYEPLHPGVYSLTVRHRFILGGDWLDSPAISFEVTP